MMFTFLIVVIALIALLLCVIILIQAGKGGGLAASFGGASSSTDSFMGGRQAANALTKMSWYGGGSFLFLALVLAVLSARTDSAPESILRQGMPGQRNLPEAPASLLEAPPDLGAGGAVEDESGEEPAGTEGDPDSGSGDPGQ
ncbi:preprotein translocase subunit SecG [Candidatus Palauibacter sp.]|uniref:preprotein translocase subunit SecG n=1 Tax=Candidatus Palauibacter sp. TaxID=3101350 RepID=UPI003AF2BB88